MSVGGLGGDHVGREKGATGRGVLGEGRRGGRLRVGDDVKGRRRGCRNKGEGIGVRGEGRCRGKGRGRGARGL